jgi:hypothetical protein
VDLVLGHAAELRRSGRLQEADGWLRQAIAIDPGNPALHFALATLQEGRGELADAAVHYTSVLTIDPGHEAARTALDGLAKRGIAPAAEPRPTPEPGSGPASAPDEVPAPASATGGEDLKGS